ncbi:MAG: hypothetical protein KDB88_08660, partial [Flavobacteriales bacterium]|nr:hypothetical protein [Flavobacteriales bacterium]
MHVLIVPKWYPGRNDPQLGDFIRKQAIELSRHMSISVLFVHPSPDLERRLSIEEHAEGALRELRVYYRPSRISLRPLRKLVNLGRFLQAARSGSKRIIEQTGVPDLTQAYILVRPLLVARFMKWRYGVPFIVSEQSSEFLDGTYAQRSWIHRAFVRSFSRSSRGWT